MKIVLYKDNTLPLDLDKFCSVLNGLAIKVLFSAGNEKFHIKTNQINCPDTFQQLNGGLDEEIKKYDSAIFATNVQYDNNYFFESYGKKVIISFSGWHRLTNLPISNGFAYFIASLLGDSIDLGHTHDENIGCLNDFWQDKRGVNSGMRSAFVCSTCLDKTDFSELNTKEIYEDIKSILNVISSHSREGLDILNIKLEEPNAGGISKLFLCHNSDDKPFVRIINNELKERSVHTWLDEEQLSPGKPWQVELEEQIYTIGSAAVFVGKNGLGPWQENEIRAFLSEFVNRGCPVIPVILPDARQIPELPIFLKQMTWIDLRKDYQGGLERLSSAIK